MNKITKGFTLAEILLTLTIIGIIASYTIPALIENVQGYTFKVSWKKTFSNLSVITNKLMLDNGGTLEGLFDAGCDSQAMHIKYRDYLNFAKDCYDYPEANGNCWHAGDSFYTLNGTPQNWMAYPSAILSDSTLINLNC